MKLGLIAGNGRFPFLVLEAAHAQGHHVTVIATDDGDGTGTPAVSQVTIPIVVADTNRAPVIAPIGNAFVDKGATLDIPIDIADVDGNPIQLTFDGLPRFAIRTCNRVGIAQ